MILKTLIVAVSVFVAIFGVGCGIGWVVIHFQAKRERRRQQERRQKSIERVQFQVLMRDRD
jgi:membrane associated rhomboid family serine protease